MGPGRSDQARVESKTFLKESEKHTMLATILKPHYESDAHLDYDADTRLGAWLKAHRRDMRLSVAQVSDRTAITQERILEIEDGTFSRGITRVEAHALAQCYCLNFAEIVGRAIA